METNIRKMNHQEKLEMKRRERNEDSIMKTAEWNRPNGDNDEMPRTYLERTVDIYMASILTKLLYIILVLKGAEFIVQINEPNY